MRALLFSLVLPLALLAPAAAGQQPAAATKLLPLAQALAGRPQTARIEVYGQFVEQSFSAPAIERQVLPGADWQQTAYASGRVFSVRRGALTARIVALPLGRGRLSVTCSLRTTVPAQKLGAALAAMPRLACGAQRLSVAVSAALRSMPTQAAVRRALLSVGARPLGVLVGPRGVYAAARVADARPQVLIGGRPVNLALRASYDKGRGIVLTVATPVLPEQWSEPE